jgi:hypothetical protein
LGASASFVVSGVGKTIRIKAIHVHYDLAVPPEGP